MYTEFHTRVALINESFLVAAKWFFKRKFLQFNFQHVSNHLGHPVHNGMMQPIHKISSYKRLREMRGKEK